ncbi:MAG: DNA-processing protein DprA [Bacteroidales bacterium]
MERDELICMVALNRALRYYGNTARELVELTGSAKGVFGLTRKDLKEMFNKEYLFFNSLLDECNIKDAQREIDWAYRNGIRILCSLDSESGYPKRLLECCDHPLILYSKGGSNLKDKKIIAVVGTRNATGYGISFCHKFIGELVSAGIDAVIISGLALGIDIEAHKAALDNGLPTIAVLAAGLDKIYPASHTATASKIVLKGALISEYPSESESFKVNFLRRNRVIAGMSDVILVVESGERGGAMITAALAASYSRELFALPGRVTDLRSDGCNQLISRNMASIFYNTDSFLESMGWNNNNNKNKLIQGKLFNGDSGEKEKILVALSNNPDSDIDQLSATTGINIAGLSSTLLELELEGRIAPIAGKRFLLLK